MVIQKSFWVVCLQMSPKRTWGHSSLVLERWWRLLLCTIRKKRNLEVGCWSLLSISLQRYHLFCNRFWFFIIWGWRCCRTLRCWTFCQSKWKTGKCILSVNDLYYLSVELGFSDNFRLATKTFTMLSSFIIYIISLTIGMFKQILMKHNHIIYFFIIRVFIKNNSPSWGSVAQKNTLPVANHSGCLNNCKSWTILCYGWLSDI